MDSALRLFLIPSVTGVVSALLLLLIRNAIFGLTHRRAEKTESGTKDTLRILHV